MGAAKNLAKIESLENWVKLRKQQKWENWEGACMPTFDDGVHEVGIES
jgi:hypothetical protein